MALLDPEEKRKRQFLIYFPSPAIANGGGRVEERVPGKQGLKLPCNSPISIPYSRSKSEFQENKD